VREPLVLNGRIVGAVRGREPLVVWILLGVVATAIVVTYSRVPVHDLYHVSGTGLRGGAGRALAFLDFPAALVALGVLAIAFEGLRSRTSRALAVAAASLCLPIFWPAVVRQSDLDARWINVPCAVGVVLAAALTATARGGPLGPLRGDRLRVAIAAVLLLVSPPWLAAELGFHLGAYRSVHLGHHHGLDGVLLALAALLLSRALPAIRGRGLGLATTAYLALMLAYGIGNAANDAWGEQVVTRGWSAWAVPSVLEPRPTWAWAVLVAATALVCATWFGRDAERIGSSG
jgi:hypothetical protein